MTEPTTTEQTDRLPTVQSVQEAPAGSRREGRVPAGASSGHILKVDLTVFTNRADVGAREKRRAKDGAKSLAGAQRPEVLGLDKVTKVPDGPGARAKLRGATGPGRGQDAAEAEIQGLSACCVPPTQTWILGHDTRPSLSVRRYVTVSSFPSGAPVINLLHVTKPHITFSYFWFRQSFKTIKNKKNVFDVYSHFENVQGS